jgi:Na+-driven multidrug efflux pump
MHTKGVYLAVAVSEVTLAVIGVLVFRRGTWKQTQV